MKCINCKEKMKLIGANDDPNKGYAYNVYECLSCMIIAKSNVWKDKGIIWIYKDNTVSIYNEK